MAGRSDIQAGKAHIEIYVKNSALVKGLQAAKEALHSFGSGVKIIGDQLSNLGNKLFNPLKQAVTSFVDIGSALADASGRTGVAASTLAEYGFAAEMTGASLEDVETALIKMQRAGHSASTFDKLAADITAIQDPTKRTQTALETFGKGGAKLLPMMASLRELRAEAQRLGVTPTDEAVANADALGDAFDSIKKVINAVIFEIGAALGPVLLPAVEIVKQIVSGFTRWVKENTAIIRTIAMIGAAVVAAGAGISVLGSLIVGVGTAFGFVATATTLLAGLLASLLSPLGLVLAGVVAIGVGIGAWLRYSESGKAALKGLLDFFAPMLAFGREVVGGIADALMAGDLTLAAKVGWQAVLVVFETAKLQMMRAWFSLRDMLLRAWGEVSLGIQTGVAFIAKLFTGLLDQLVPGWQFGMKLIGVAVAAAWTKFKDTALGAFAVVRAGLDILIGKLQSFLKGLQIATKTAVAIAPHAVKAAGGVANDEIKSFLGVDVGKLLGDATQTAGDVNAAGRAKLDADKGTRNEADNAALTEQERKIAEREAELDKLTAAAKAARETADAKKNDIKAPDITQESGRGAFATFSAVGLAAQGGGANGLSDLASNTKEARREAYQQRKETLKAIYELEKTTRKMGIVGP